jgi:hypothetical protein
MTQFDLNAVSPRSSAALATALDARLKTVKTRKAPRAVASRTARGNEDFRMAFELKMFEDMHSFLTNIQPPRNEICMDWARQLSPGL